MLRRRQHPNEVVTYFSPLLEEAGVPHGFSTRIGGLSRGPFASLNLAQTSGGPSTESGDSDDAVPRNYDLLRQALGVRDHALIWCRQVHGCVTTLAPPTSQDAHPDADALLSDKKELLLSVRVADCVPILLASADGRAVAAVHAGWRGIMLGVIPAALGAMRERYGVAPGKLLAAIGPCISAEHFEVGPEVADAFDKADLSHAVIRTGFPKPHIELARACAAQLERAGVPAGSIDRTDRCTYRDADEFFSHRRDKGRTGRMAAVIAVKG
jgi:polyphenol oxidase